MSFFKNPPTKIIPPSALAAGQTTKLSDSLEITPTDKSAPKFPELTKTGDNKYPLSAEERKRRLDVSTDAVDDTSDKVIAKTAADTISSILSERGSRYGLFKTHAQVTQAYKAQTAEALKSSGVILSPDQQEALDMIHHKIGRIVNGDPNYADSWIDIAGYAKLVSDRLEGKSESGV